MGKSRKIDVMKSVNKTASEALPVVDKGLQTVGTTAKDVAQSSIPLVEAGVSRVYGTMARGLDLGIEGVQTVSKNFRNRSRNISRGLSRGRTRALARGLARTRGKSGGLKKSRRSRSKRRM
jgi:hypothetical protein